jgi:hypothetical protein
MKFNYKIAFYIVSFIFAAFFYSIITLEERYVEDYQSEIDSLKTLNLNILKEIELDKIVIKGYEHSIDSLENQKKK